MDKVVDRRRKGRPKARLDDRKEADLLEKRLNERDYKNKSDCRRRLHNSHCMHIPGTKENHFSLQQSASLSL